MNPPHLFEAPLRYDAGEFVVRCYEPGDGPALQRAVTASYEHLKPWMPWARIDQTVEETEDLCLRLAKSYKANEDFTLGIWQGNEVIGGTGFHLRCGPIENKCAEIGMWIAGSVANQGMGTKVLDAMLDWGFTEWSWYRLVWKCDTRNVASARVAEKCGLTLEGTTRSDALDVEGNRRDTHIYGILYEEWLHLREGAP